jgi:putative tricarboxylic transport membrane protein
MLENILLGIGQISHLSTMFVIYAGLMLGIIIGAIPGLTGVMAVSLALPLTFKMSAIDGLSLLIALYCGAMIGGLISAILLKIPGTPSAIATTFDGYPMAFHKGEPGLALNIGIFSSLIGGLFSALCLFLMAPAIARAVLKISPLDFFSIVLFAIVLIGALSSGSYLKGIIAGFVGLFISAIGWSPIDNVYRFTFGLHELEGGFSLASVLIGLLAMSQVFIEIQNIEKKVPKFNLNFKTKLPKISFFLKHKVNFIRSALIGEVVGIIPGIGGAAAGMISWMVARDSSKHPEKFGTGIAEGIISPETANNAATGGALVPLLTLGIPGSPVTAIMFGALMMKGIQPGPMVFFDNPEIIYGLFMSLFLANIGMFILMIFLVKPFAMVLKIPKYFLLPVIVLFCIVGTYTINNRFFDSFTVILFGLLAYLMNNKGYSIAPMAMGFILGKIAETNLRIGLSASRGSFLPLITRPVSLSFLMFTFLFLIYLFFKSYRKVRKKKHA